MHRKESNVAFLVNCFSW